MTLDQLCYVLERKYKNIKIGQDVLVICSTSVSDESNMLIRVPDARLMNWKVKHIQEPSQENLEEWWGILSEQYHSDPSRMDSDILKRLAPAQAVKPVEEVKL